MPKRTSNEWRASITLLALAGILTGAAWSFRLFPASAGAHAGVAEVRALWVVRTSLETPDGIRQMVTRASAGGFNTLIVQVRGRGDAYYRSRWEQRADRLEARSEAFDPLELTVKEAHHAGLAVHAWLNTFLVANVDELPRSRKHTIYEHPDWLMVPRAVAGRLYNMDAGDPRYATEIINYSKGDRPQVEGLYLSPANPAVKERIYSVWMDVLEHYEVDGLHFDYVRYPSAAFDYGRVPLDRFREIIEKGLGEGERKVLAAAAEREPLTYAVAFPERFAQFQREQVTEVVERVVYGIKARRPAAILSAAVFADAEDAYNNRFQDWRLWLRRGLIDVACPMAYTPDTETFRKQIGLALGSASGREVWAGIGAYRVPPESTIEKIRAARELGAHGFALFSYDSLTKSVDQTRVGDYIDRIKPVVTQVAGSQ